MTKGCFMKNIFFFAFLILISSSLSAQQTSRIDINNAEHIYFILTEQDKFRFVVAYKGPHVGLIMTLILLENMEYADVFITYRFDRIFNWHPSAKWISSRTQSLYSDSISYRFRRNGYDHENNLYFTNFNADNVFFLYLWRDRSFENIIGIDFSYILNDTKTRLEVTKENVEAFKNFLRLVDMRGIM